MSTSILTRIADAAHKVAVTGLFGTFCFGTYAVTNQVLEGRSGNRTGNGNVNSNGNSNGNTEEHPQAGFINMLREKAQEEYKKYYKIDHREWYDKDDDSYLKQIPRPEEYAPKKK